MTWAITWRVLFWTLVGPYWVIIWVIVNSEANLRTWTRFNPLPPLRK